MTFETEAIITGIVHKTSTKTNKPYTILLYLDDDGSTFTSMLAEDVNVSADITQLSTVKAKFEVTKYNGNIQGLKTLALEKVS